MEQSMDQIQIYGLDVFAHHGVYPEENEKGQHFIVNAVLYTTLRQAGLTDELEGTTNYGEVCHAITRFMQEHTWKLIETVAEQTAREILIQFPLVHGVELEIQKPEAPIGLPFQTVSVKICRSWHKAYLALGSNMGDKEGYIRQALQSMDANPEIRVGKCSTLIRTAPYGGVEQDDFLNGAVEIETLLPPLELLEELHRLEQNANRERKIHWGPRTLDLDILLYDNDIISVEQLMVPHPDMLNRTFVLEPMAEIAPYLRHPLEGKTMVQLLKELKERTECGA
jgi:dihydroneopterin aldolase/2-amino-4-hydroxy-6-hydroxymethyldihydropteridine diphosphokinase